MDHEQKLTELLNEIKKSTDKQVLYSRLQCIFSIVAALCCVILLVAGLKILPELRNASAQAETVLNNLETVTTELAGIDLGSMVENVDGLVQNVDTLVTTSQNGVEQTMKKIDAIDFDTLNKAIDDLSRVIEPIANFFKAFKL